MIYFFFYFMAVQVIETEFGIIEQILIHGKVFNQKVVLRYIFINLLEMPALALVLAGLLYYFQAGENSSNQYYFYNNPNIITYIIIAVIIAIFVGLTVSAEEIINDKKILRREAFLNLSRFSYLLSKVGILAILSAIQVALFVWIGNSILQIKDMFLDYWIILFTSAVFANLLGLIV